MPELSDSLSEQFDKRLGGAQNSQNMAQPSPMQPPASPMPPQQQMPQSSMPPISQQIPQQPQKQAKPPKPPREKRHIRVGLILIILLVLAILGAGGAAGYLYMSNTPEKQLETFFTQLNQVQSVEVSGKIDATGTQDAYPQAPSAWISVLNLSTPINSLLKEYDTSSQLNMTYATDFRGNLDMTHADRIDGSIKFNASVTSGNKNPDFAVSAQDVFVKNTHYLTFTNLQARSFDAKKQEDSATYLEKTIKLDANKLAGHVIDTYDLPGSMKKDAENLIAQLGITPAHVASLITALKEKSVVSLNGTIQDRFLTVDTDGVQTHHYNMNIDKQAFAQSVTEKTLSTFIANASDISGEIWIGAQDNLPHRITLTMNMPQDSGFAGSITMLFSFDKFNNASTIDLPTEAIEATDVADALLPLLYPITTTTPDTLVDTDLDGLSDVDEATYGTSPTNPDTDDDGFKDGDEVKGGYNPNGPGKLDQN